ncbi:hypothetical protein [Spirosoma areae]
MDEKAYIHKCLIDVEQKLQWANREKWVYEDFKQLQGLIFDASGISLSVHTLERLFGKLKTQQNYNPQTETKNALVLFLGYKSWNQFKTENKLINQEKELKDSLIEPTIELSNDVQTVTTNDIDISRTIPSVKAAIPREQPKAMRFRIALAVVICFSLVLAFVYFSVNPFPAAQLAASFETPTPYGRVPHTVKFIFNSHSPKLTNLLVDFGESENWIIKESRSAFFKTYMNPGIFKVSVKQDSQVVATTTVFIDTDGWQGYIYRTYEDNNTRNLLPGSSLRVKNKLYTNPVLLDDTLKKDIYFIESTIVNDFHADGDNLTFDTRFKSNVRNGGKLCNDMWFKLTGTKGILKMHFLAVGCSGYTQMIFGDQRLDGHIQDLTAFTQDFSDWKTARMKVVNKHVSIYFDDKLIYQTTYKKPIGDIMALSITSKGSGETDYVRLYDRTMNAMFTDDFN